MFGKLLKNDLKAQLHSISIVLLCIVIVTALLEGLAIFLKNDMIAIICSILVSVVLIFACIIMVIAVSMVFSKTVFGRAGYLTLTLPAKTSALVWSKTVSGLIWIFTVFALMVGSLFLFVYQAYGRLGDVLYAAEDLLSLFGAPSLKIIFSLVAIYVIYFAIYILLAVQCIYLGITVSNVSPLSKLGALTAIIVTFVGFIFVTVFSKTVGNFLPFEMLFTDTTIVFTTDVAESLQKISDDVVFRENLTKCFISLIFALGLNFPITYLVKNKVNIK